MIRKLKLKFILTNMILICCVLLGSFCFIYISSANDLKKSSINAMHDIAESKHGGAEYLFEPNEKRESKYSYLSTYIIEIDSRTNTCYIDGFGDVDNLTNEQIAYVNDLIHAVGDQNKIEGILENYNLRYYCTDTPHGLRIVLLDKNYEDVSLQQLLVSFLIIGTIATVAFLIISIIVAGIAVKPIEKSIRQQQQLVADVSHELKTPITVISTNTDIIMSHNESTVEEERKWLGYIKDETKRMSELVSMMLYLAKSDEETAKLPLFDFDISNAAYEISLPFESVCFENGKELIINIESDITIKGDEASIKQLLVILLDNAVKYSNDKGRIELKLYSNSDKAFISVFNTGEPIPKESIPYLFDRFYRVDKSRSREKGGSGLGLSIAKRIIENNEGNISVTSDIAHGTVFICTFNISKPKKKDI